MELLWIYFQERISMSSQISIPYEITLDDLMKCKGHTFSMDTETTGLNWWSDRLTTVGVYCKDLDLKGCIETPTDSDRKRAIEAVHEFGEESTIIMHNAKFDLHFLRMKPSVQKFTVLDTTVMVHLLDSRNKKALKDAELTFLGSESKRAHVESAPLRVKVWDWPKHIRVAYCANDCLVTYQLAETLYPRLEEFGLDKLFWKDMRYLQVLFDIEERGVLLDEDFVIRSASKLEEHVNVMASQLYDSCGQTFNWRSPQQLSRAIYDGLGIAKPVNPFLSADGIDHSRFADAGKYKSTCTSTFLLTEKVHHPLGELISSMREADKLRKTYLKWLELQDSNNVLHTNFNQTGTRTGRLSSSKPNLQNIASNVRGRFTQSVFTGNIERTDEYNLRKAIIARPGFSFLSVDYKQMEMRMFGILSKDPFMLDALLAGKDVHLEIALKVWGDCGYSSNMIHREWSKTISFGLIYGMTLGSLQFKLNMTRFEASKVTDQYWAQFPRIKPWMSEIIESCKLTGYVKYWSGRLWREDNPLDMYKGCNALIQGGCADLLSIAAIRVDDWSHLVGDNVGMVNLVHDETITEIPEDHILAASRKVSSIMTVEDLLGIPFATDCKIGTSYGDMIKIDKSLLSDPSLPEYNYLQLMALAQSRQDAIEAKDADIEDDDDDEESSDESGDEE
jgi:DNA polymerase-1